MEEKKDKELKPIAPKEETIAPDRAIDASKVTGSYLILTRSGNQIKKFAVFNGTISILPIDVLGGAYELK